MDGAVNEESSIVEEDNSFLEAFKVLAQLKAKDFEERFGKYIHITPEAVERVVQTAVWTLENRWKLDIERFKTHAKRTKINCEDAKLIFRRDPKVEKRVDGLFRSLAKHGVAELPKLNIPPRSGIETPNLASKIRQYKVENLENDDSMKDVPLNLRVTTVKMVDLEFDKLRRDILLKAGEEEKANNLPVIRKLAIGTPELERIRKMTELSSDFEATKTDSFEVFVRNGVLKNKKEMEKRERMRKELEAKKADDCDVDSLDGDLNIGIQNSLDAPLIIEELVRQPDFVIEKSEAVTEITEVEVERSVVATERPKAVVERTEAVVEKPGVVIERAEAIIESPAVVVKRPVAVVERTKVVIQRPEGLIQAPENVIGKPEVVIQKDEVAIERSDVLKELVMSPNQQPVVITINKSGNLEEANNVENCDVDSLDGDLDFGIPNSLDAPLFFEEPVAQPEAVVKRPEIAIERPEVVIQKSESSLGRQAVAIERAEVVIERSEAVVDRHNVVTERNKGVGKPVRSHNGQPVVVVVNKSKNSTARTMSAESEDIIDHQQHDRPAQRVAPLIRSTSSSTATASTSTASTTPLNNRQRPRNGVTTPATPVWFNPCKMSTPLVEQSKRPPPMKLQAVIVKKRRI
ncbi:unnamed protein product [Bursaphelenchus okinawaensis]|uniref:Centromere protein S n=1 Tax=Bursaphelenchus okinawaensis TaxID=465554 RepID=A0A811K4G4_9BILA|nr:unnamed protein product [Bursaphelenchus okinawaensis]CAG9092236.1 unnamed protein product [Bursaphelenchus okinawaensis]